MQRIIREMKAEVVKSCERENCQASFNSDGNIVFRNYNTYDKINDELIVLSRNETQALFKLFRELKAKNCDLPF